MMKQEFGIKCVVWPLILCVLYLSSCGSAQEVVGTYEAEDAILSNVYLLQKNNGYNGQGYADFQTHGSHMSWNITAATTGKYIISVRYSSGSTRPLDLFVDEVKQGSFAFMETNDWNVWYTETFSLSLTEGDHRVKLLATQSKGPNIDRMTLEFHGRQLASKVVVLESGSRLSRGHFVDSPSGDYKVGLTSGGNFVLQDKNSATIWSSGTSDGHRLYMQSDGNLVLRTSSGSSRWKSRSHGNPGARFVLDDGGKITVVSANGAAIWRDVVPKAKDFGPRPPRSHPSDFDRVVVLKSDSRLDRGDYVESPSGDYKVGLTNGGNLVLQDKNSKIIWSSGTNDGYRLFMQSDGNLILRTSSGSSRWMSGSHNNRGAQFVLDDGGQISVVSAIHKATVWLDGVPRGSYTRASSADLTYPLRGTFYYPVSKKSTALVQCNCHGYFLTLSLSPLHYSGILKLGQSVVNLLIFSRRLAIIVRATLLLSTVTSIL
jgi:hypothetical protein